MRVRGRRRGRARRTLSRGVHLIPSLFTTANIFFGFVSIVLATTGDLEKAALLLGIAALLDALDGRVARMTGTSSEFGREFDSLADVVSFGVAPAILAWKWALAGFGRLGWAAAFIFVICSAVRLARFNIQTGPDRRYFVGLPTPPAACTIAACVFLHPYPLEDPLLGAMGLLLVVTISGLMVSRIRYRSFKDLDLRARRPYLWVVPLAVVMALIAAHPQLFLLVSAFVYVLSGFLTRRGSAPRGAPLPEAVAASGAGTQEHVP